MVSTDDPHEEHKVPQGGIGGWGEATKHHTVQKNTIQE